MQKMYRIFIKYATIRKIVAYFLLYRQLCQMLFSRALGRLRILQALLSYSLALQTA